MTNEDIAKAREIIAAATPGPWGMTYDGSGDYSIGLAHDPQVERIFTNAVYIIADFPDGRFIVAARTGWPEALSEVERYQEALRDANKCYAEMFQERDKLRAVAEAASMVASRGCYHCSGELNAALKAWRSEPSGEP